MGYLDQGYDRFFYKNRTENTEYNEDQASFVVSQVSGSNISGGIQRSPDGKLEINWETGTILIYDGAFPRILAGFQEGGF